MNSERNAKTKPCDGQLKEHWKHKRKTERKRKHERKELMVKGGFSTYNKEAIQTLKILSWLKFRLKYFSGKPNSNNGNLYAPTMVLVANTKSRIYQQKLSKLQYPKITCSTTNISGTTD